MSLVASSLQTAVQLHQSGQLDRAADLYRQVLETEPAHADALHLLGLVHLTQGRPREAIGFLTRAIQSNPALAPFHFHLGCAYSAASDFPAAIASFRAALRIDPRSAAIHNELGGALGEDQQFAAAEASYREALALDPTLTAALNNLGNVLHRQGRLDEAMAAFSQAIAERPEIAELHFNLGNCYKSLKRLAEAADCYRRALALNPELRLARYRLGLVLNAAGGDAEAAECFRELLARDPADVDALNAFGVTLQALGNHARAEACYRRVLELQPANVSARFYLATALQMQHRLDEAQELYDECVEPMADQAPLHFNRARCLQLQDRFAESMAGYRRAIELDPDYADAHYYMSTALLTQGQFAEGWREYEWRRKAQFAWRHYDQPRWDGRPLERHQVLIHAEWGLGDTLHFVRYVPLVVARGGEVVLAVQRPLLPLLAASGFKNVIAVGDPAPATCQLRVPILSLPALFDTTLSSIPAQIPYLYAKAELIELWNKELQTLAGYRIGLQWGGSAAAALDGRSIPLAEFEPLARLPGVQLIALQKGDGLDQLTALADRFPLANFDDRLDNEHGALMDTAAIMKNVDLVVTSDSATAHLAGALGVKVWMPLVKNAEWRWLRDRDDSPWYPTMRLFRQSKLDCWTDVIERIAAEVAVLARNKPG